MNGKEILQKYVVVEGHRDVYEQLIGRWSVKTRRCATPSRQD